MKALVNWLDTRTGFRGYLQAALFEHIPGGARWRYAWGSTLVFAFVTQVITGIFLWMAYSPSSQTAWESVYYIQHQMYGGWLLRGLHHFMAQAMIVLLALHLMQVVIDGAYKAPREINFWLGLILMQIVLGLSLTGYLLPWDQKGYWATRVATNLMGILPVVGPAMQKIVVGGADYGHHTLTRFFALHAGVLPALLVGFLALHVALFRRHGLHAKQPLKKPDCMFWPDQVLKDAVACLAVLAVVLFLIVRPVLFDGVQVAPLGDYLGAELGAPADRANEYSAARPEWYFLFLFQFLKLFEGMGEMGEMLGAIVLPGMVMGFLFLMPILGRWKLGHRFNVGMLFALLIGIGLLTAQAMWDDRQAQYISAPPADASKHAVAKYEASKKYLAAVEDAEFQSHRALELARSPQGIPSQGVLSLLRADPESQGPRLFRRSCVSCHSHANGEGHGMVAAESSAPNLYGFATRAWIAGLLDPKRIDGPDYFGYTSHKAGDMVGFVKDDLPEKASPEIIQQIAAALSAEASLPDQRAIDLRDDAMIAAGRKQIVEVGCTDCHKFHDDGELGSAPDLTGYGSADWLKGMVGDPNHERFYADGNDRMPAFGVQLTPDKLELLIAWLRGDWYEPKAPSVP